MEHLSNVKGRLIFTSRAAIFAINADGSQQVLLAQGNWPSWSPDGKYILFAQGTPSTAISIALMAVAPPHGVREIIPNGTAPVWSPNGQSILYTSGTLHAQDLRVAQSDGMHQRQLATEGGYEAAWSPTGTHIAFRCRAVQLCSINSDGSHLYQVTNDGGGSPSWSPDGMQIVFAAHDGIYRVQADGSGVQRVAQLGAHQDYPTWSPGGKWIAFIGDRSNDDRPAAQSLYLVQADGTQLTRLTDPATMNVVGKPVWSSDGATIAVPVQTAPPSTTRAIYLVRTDGSAMTKLVDDGDEPHWQP